MSTRPLRVGIVCPYSFDAPGGVQFHVRDLAQALVAQGHEASVLAPADEDTPVPDVVTPAGRAVPVRYNGSVARLAFGPRAAARVRRWIDAGRFDVLHLHEPMTPSLSMLALWIAEGPVVATFHTAQVRSRALQVAYPLLRQSLEKIAARIAVSEDARRTLVDHLGGDAVVIPNGVYVDTFAAAPAQDRWRGTPAAPTIAFLGRLDEPRKGLEVLVAAAPRILEKVPGARFLVAGRGDAGRQAAEAALGEHAASFEWLGGISDEDKAALLGSVDLYVAPQTGGESFGIVLVEAMSAGAAVVASDLGAFRRVLDDGCAGRLFRTGDAADLADQVLAALADPEGTHERRERATAFVRRFDWSAVTAQVLAVYEMAVAAGEAIGTWPVHRKAGA
ncbi:phosphatidylinositol alpha-mannosyltransferase [Isoptericola variabilis J7]|uniref:D-inositol 3-phosphate glycosyltransferase n=1 Tax=Isoptericola variabilis (strain 225) TaxID=743718 RepID=F6FVI6_ISOV2|nr:Phosphatidylinositol alpha-mannosyltransferase [Isoptericola variabilis 225]TWH34406.1 phosphatidylinositol alpha-mannosyltransferase [Isoptericola variabilis J7]